MCLVLVDFDGSALEKAVQTIKGVQGVGEVLGEKVDVGDIKQVEALREKVFDVFGEVGDLEHELHWVGVWVFGTEELGCDELWTAGGAYCRCCPSMIRSL